MAKRRKVFAASWLFLPLALALLSGSPSTAHARDPLRREVKSASERLRDYFAGRRVKEIAVGEVSNADPTMPSSSGSGLRKLLIDELERAELKVKLRATVGLSASFRARKIPVKDDRKAMHVVVEIRFTAMFNQDNS